MSQNTWKTSRPAPYVSGIPWVQDTLMTESIQSRLASVIDGDSVDCKVNGHQSLRHSWTRQCGWSEEGEGVRPSHYGCGLPEEDEVQSSALN